MFLILIKLELFCLLGLSRLLELNCLLELSRFTRTRLFTRTKLFTTVISLTKTRFFSLQEVNFSDNPYLFFNEIKVFAL